MPSNQPHHKIILTQQNDNCYLTIKFFNTPRPWRMSNHSFTSKTGLIFNTAANAQISGTTYIWTPGTENEQNSTTNKYHLGTNYPDHEQCFRENTEAIHEGLKEWNEHMHQTYPIQEKEHATSD